MKKTPLAEIEVYILGYKPHTCMRVCLLATFLVLNRSYFVKALDLQNHICFVCEVSDIEQVLLRRYCFYKFRWFLPLLERQKYTCTSCILMTKSSQWSSLVLPFFKGFTAHKMKNLNVETEKSEQTTFAQISLSQY